MTAAMEGDSYQHCPRDIGDPNCIKSNSSSGRKRIFSFQPFPKLPVSWNQVIERYTSESLRSIYSLKNVTGNLTLDRSWASSLQSLPRGSRVFGSPCLDSQSREGLLPFGPCTYSGGAGWMWVNDQTSLPAVKCLVLDLEQIVDVSTAHIGKAPPLIGSISSFQTKNFLEVNDTICCGQGRAFYRLPLEQLLYLIFQAFNLFNLALRGWSFCCWSQWQFCDGLEWSLSQDWNYLSVKGQMML